MKVAHLREAVLRPDDDTIHPFYNCDGTFLAEIGPYLSGNPELVEVPYLANITQEGDKHDLKFERNKNLPAAAVAAVDRAKRDQLFDASLAHSVALAYNDEIAAFMNENGVVCHNCGEPATTVLQCPLTKMFSDYRLTNMFATPCCAKGPCIHKAKITFMRFNDVLKNAVESHLPPPS
mmetsp:Transcript_15985/g.34757  ORF Transcript_15985/g.34757 Transcript_15985/m.34757 type:complete len:178 (-) Transcript_15985:25-558(-)